MVALLAAFLAGCVSGLSGFGLTLISVPLFLFVYDPKTTVVVTAVLSLFINVAVVWDSWRDADRRMVLALLLPALAGVVVGVEVLRVEDPDYIRLAVSLVVVFSALLLLREVRLPEAESRWGPVVAGSTSGALSSSTTLDGPRRSADSPAPRLPRLPQASLSCSNVLYFLFMSLAGLAALLFCRLVEGGTSGSSSLSFLPAFSARSSVPRS